MPFTKENQSFYFYFNHTTQNEKLIFDITQNMQIVNWRQQKKNSDVCVWAFKCRLMIIIIVSIVMECV